MQVELDKVAYAYFSIDSITNLSQLYPAKLTGSKRLRERCTRCTPTVSCPTCGNCEEDLEQGHTYRLHCRHVLYDQCVEKVPGRIEAVTVHRCSVCYEYGFPTLLR